MMRKIECWIDSTCWDHELGQSLGGEKLFSSELDLRENMQCIDMEEFDGVGMRVQCRAKRVYVVDADEFDAAKEILGR